MTVKKETLIKTYIDNKIAAILEKKASDKGLSLNEYVRVTLGEKANEEKKK